MKCDQCGKVISMENCLMLRKETEVQRTNFCSHKCYAEFWRGTPMEKFLYKEWRGK